MKVHVVNSTTNAVYLIIADDHVGYDIVKGIIGVAVTTHEYVDRHVAVFRPCMDGDVRLSECDDSGDATTLVKLMKITMQDLCPSVFSPGLHDRLKESLIL